MTEQASHPTHPLEPLHDELRDLIAANRQRLAQKFGRGFEAKNLRCMVQFAQACPDAEIVASLMRQLNWTHFLQLLPLKTESARHFYARQCMAERRNVRELHWQIERKAFERSEIAGAQGTALTAPSANASALAVVFKDPYILDFPGLRQLEAFILELGRGFAFVEL